MIGRGSSRGVWIVIVLLVCAVAPRIAAAQRWHELYADGLVALRNGQARRAAELLRRAIEERPRPGRLVPTYGTNFEAEYFPHLHLAEAFLLLDEGEEALGALEASARFGVAPPEKRAALEKQARALIEAKRPSDPPLASEPAAPPEPTPAPTPEPTPTPAPPPPVAAVVPPAGAPERASPPAPAVPPLAEAASREAAAAPPATPPPASTRVLVVTSDPPGARVFLDDEPVGRTDPQSGRLSLRDLGAGRHQVRLSSAGRQDFVREVEITGEPVYLEARLPPPPLAPPQEPPEPAPLPGGPRRFGLVAGGVLALILVVGLLIRATMWHRTAPAISDETPSFLRSPAGAGTDEILPMSFGDYSLVRRIGKGGMAVVYEAERRGLTLALKRPLPGFLDDDRFRERFLREAELGRTLHHPNIIRILDRGQVGTAPYLAMELIRGETLAARLDREGRLGVPEAVRLTAQVAEALDYAHSKGVIHRDLKPSNVMIEASGAVKVMDYGIARAQHLEGLTTTGAFLGTPSYVAPETVEAASLPASDLYALGVVLFEMLTGSLPFAGATAFAVLKNHCTTPPPRPSSLNQSLPAELDRLVLRLLSKDPSDRPSAEELRNELSDYLVEGR